MPIPDRTIYFIEANGLRHAYLEEGSGPLVLLMHGFPDSPYSWNATRTALAARGYRAVSPFLRGYAPSDIPARDTSVETIGHDILGLIEALGEDSAILVGHDWGAAGSYAAAAFGGTRRLRKLVTIGIPHPLAIRPSPALLLYVRHFFYLRRAGAAARLRADNLEYINTLYRRWSPTWNFDERELADVKTIFAEPASLDAAIGYYRAIQFFTVPDFAKVPIEVPTLAFAGLGDPGIKVPVYEKAVKHFRSSYEVAAIPGGHFMHRESPDAFHERLLAFLAVN